MKRKLEDILSNAKWVQDEIDRRIMNLLLDKLSSSSWFDSSAPMTLLKDEWERQQVQDLESIDGVAI